MDSEKEKLEYANKLIFVKEYLKAFKLLEEIINQNSFSDHLLPLAHLRRIELSVKLEKTEELLELYRNDFHTGKTDPHLCQICIDLIEQQIELVPLESSVKSFRSHIESHERSLLPYFGLASALEAQGNYDHAIFNYEQVIQMDAQWYPAYFGLSQVYYQMEDEVKGDYYFYLFEKSAPYNLYGNFETHKKLSFEFLRKKEYLLSEIAITTLSDWWYENKGFCPSEIQLYESLFLSRIAKAKGAANEEQNHLLRVEGIASDALRSLELTSNSAYFMARALEEHDLIDYAKDFYKKSLAADSVDSQMIQKIGSQLLANSNISIAKEVIDYSFEHQPENSDIRFLKLIVDLKINEVDIEHYLAKKERLSNYISSGSPQFEILALIHELISDYPRDSDVRKTAAEVYSQAGNHEIALQHFKEMQQLDPSNIGNILTFGDYLLNNGFLRDLKSLIDSLKVSSKSEHSESFQWLNARLLYHSGKIKDSLDGFDELLKNDPWNVAYLTYHVVSLTKHLLPQKNDSIDQSLKLLIKGEEDKIDWQEFNKVTFDLEKKNLLNLCYKRTKLAFLFSQGSTKSLDDIVHFATKLDPKRAIHELMSLLNTNFDHPMISYSIGILSKELWQHEVAMMWFEQMMLKKSASEVEKSKCYLEIADSMAWMNMNLTRAEEYARFAMEAKGEKDSDRILKVLAHIYLLKGNSRQSMLCLDQLKISSDFESIYLKGLVLERNGAKKQARELWKPLISKKTDNTRLHYLKQDLLKLYFQEKEYFEVN